MEPLYESAHSELALAFAQAGFDETDGNGFSTLSTSVSQRLAALLRGPARDRVVRQAQRLTSWPLALLMDIPPLAFIGFSAYKIVRAYFSTSLLTGVFFLHAAAVLAIILGVELLLLSLATRTLAWTARQSAAAAVRAQLDKSLDAFAPERAHLEKVQGHLEEAKRLKGTIMG